MTKKMKTKKNTGNGKPTTTTPLPYVSLSVADRLRQADADRVVQTTSTPVATPAEPAKDNAA